MKRKLGKTHMKFSKTDSSDADSDDDTPGNIFTDEISEFTDARNKIDLKENDSESEEEEEVMGLGDYDDDESDEEIGEWSKRLKQIKFQAKLDKKKILPDAPERSWGKKRSDFYGSSVRRKPKTADNDEEDEWLMEEKEIEKLQKRLDEDIEEEDFLVPSLAKRTQQNKENDLKVKRALSAKEREKYTRQFHPEAEPLREELNKCLEEVENIKGLKGWKAESRDTVFRLLGANIAFYLHMLETASDTRGHPVLKRIVQWKRLAKIYESIPLDMMGVSDEDDPEMEDSLDSNTQDAMQKSSVKRAKFTLSDSEEGDELPEELQEDTAGSRPITYEIEKNKPKKKSAPNNPRVKHREKFRKAGIRRRGKIREPRPELHKYQGEASGIRSGIVRSTRLK